MQLYLFYWDTDSKVEVRLFNLSLKWLPAASPPESWQKVADFWWARGRSVDWEHEHCTGRQQEALSDEWRDHPDVPTDESYLWAHGPGGGFTSHGKMTITMIAMWFSKIWGHTEHAEFLHMSQFLHMFCLSGIFFKNSQHMTINSKYKNIILPAMVQTCSLKWLCSFNLSKRSLRDISWHASLCF